MKLKYKHTFIFLITLITFAFFVAAWGLLFTQFGIKYVSKLLFDSMATDQEITWQKNEGNLISGMVYTDIVLEDLKWFPIPNKLTIQLLTLDINAIGLAGLSVNVENARLNLPDADPILFYGSYEKQLLDFNIYSESLTDTEIKYFFKKVLFKKLIGSLTGVDVYIKGTLEEPVFSGEFIVDKIQKNNFILEKAPCTFEIILKRNDDKLGVYGPLIFESGTIKGEKTALVRLKESKILFDGDPGKPNFDIKAAAIVEKVKMDIVLKGSFKVPDLQIKSEPSLPKDRLLLALATNKTWQNTEDLFNKGILAPEMIKDFIDYFIFGGKANKFAEKFGLKSISLKYDDSGKGVAVIKDLSDKIEGKYEIEEKKKKDTKPDVSQKVGGEYKVTESISLEVKKELKQNENKGQQENKQKDDQLLLKIQKSF